MQFKLFLFGLFAALFSLQAAAYTLRPSSYADYLEVSNRLSVHRQSLKNLMTFILLLLRLVLLFVAAQLSFLGRRTQSAASRRMRRRAVFRKTRVRGTTWWTVEASLAHLAPQAGLGCPGATRARTAGSARGTAGTMSDASPTPDGA